MLEINKIHLGDCLELMKLIPDWSIDAIITDPPYWTTACKWDTVIPFDLMWEQLKRIIKPNWAIVLFGSEPFSSALRMSNIKQYKYDWVWEKERPTNIFWMKSNPWKVHEIISVFGWWSFYPQKEASLQPKNNKWNKSQTWYMNVIETLWNTKMKIWSSYDSTLRNPRSVLKINRWTKGNKKLHPTQKPVALIEYLIRTYTNEWETVLDFTIGSGTTAIACINTNRNYIGFELDKWYFDIANKRLSEIVEKK